MKKLKPLKPSDPKLRKKCARVSLKELKSKKFQNSIEQMLDFVYIRNNKGEKQDPKKERIVGLSANQVGILKRMSVIDLAIGHNNYSDIHILINPKIIWHSKVKTRKNEGCVNLPSMWGSVARYKEVKVEAIDRSGNKIIIHAKNWPAVLLQHEIDHLDGYLFIDHLLDFRKAHKVENRELPEYRKKFKRWDRFVDVSELVRK